MKMFIAIALLLVAPLANARLVTRDLIARDDGLLTLDSSTGLEWLDVSLTKGLSVSDILAGQGGWLGAGFRYADFGDISTLFMDGAGMRPLNDDAEFGSKSFLEFMSGQGDAGLRMAAMLGPTDVYLDTGRLITGGYVAPIPCGGWTSNVCDPTSGTYTSTYTYYVRLNASSESSSVQIADGPVPLSRTDWGNYLVRETPHAVPEPSTSTLMALGLAAIAIATRRRLPFQRQQV